MISERAKAPDVMVLRVLEFTETPGARYYEDGQFSGQEFRERFLEPRFLEARRVGTALEVDLDGAYGYATSFLEEAFGGLAEKYTADVVRAHIVVKCDDEPPLMAEIAGYIDRGKARSAKR